MIKRILYCTCIVFVATLQSCKNNLNTLAPYKEIPVVYGLMDQSDTIHYIRVNKAYQGTGNAYTMAQQYDSINYPAGTITVQLVDVNTNKTITLDTTSSVYIVPGIFSYPKQLLYYTKSKLNVNDQYNLVVTNERTGKVVTGSTTLLQDVTVNGINSSPYFSVSWLTNLPSRIYWNPVPNGAIYQITMRFSYHEVNTAKDTTYKYIDWVFPPLSGADSTNYQYTYTGQSFLQFLYAYIPVSPGVSRYADTMNIMMTSASNDFLTYLNLSQPSLGVNQEKPFYTNLKNGIGIFTARHSQSFKKILSPAEIDSIETDPLTKNLGF